MRGPAPRGSRWGRRQPAGSQPGRALGRPARMGAVAGHLWHVRRL